MTATRNPTDIPFASTSVWNIGIGSNAQWSLSTDVDARQLHGLRGTVTTANWGQPIYFGTASDPLVTVTDTDPLFPTPPQQIHIPINALPAAGSGGYTPDAHMAFYDATQPGKMWSYYGCSFNNGRDVTGGITAKLGSVWDTTGDGITNTVSPGNEYNFAVGTITDYDVSQAAINHMVRLSISPDALKSPGATWDQNIPWPNGHEDYYGPRDYTGSIVAGSTFGIPMSVNLNSLGLSQGGMMLAKALQNYGGIWRDSGGSNQITFYSTPENQNNPLIQQMQADMAKIVPVIEVLRNQGPNSVNGGGTPVVPPLPPISLDGTTTPPVIVPPTSSDQIVLTPTSGGSITDASGNVWTITQAKDVDKNGVPTPGGGGSAALTYVAATQTVWAQDAATLRWYSWTNGMWTGPAATSPVGNPPVVDPPVVTPPATGTPREQLLAYLQSITGNHTLIGQTTYADNNAFIADTQAFGFSPAIMFNDPWLMQWAGNAPYDPSFMPTALAHAKAGGIVGMSLLLPNPVDGGPAMSGGVDPVQLLTPGSALNGSLNRELDQAAGLLQQFKDAGVAVLTRFMFELDGGWFWWGDGHFSNAQQTQLYRYIVNYLRVTKGLDNLLTTFAINGGPGDYQYPGDDVVDIVGIDAYTSDLAGVYKGIYDTLRAQAPTKLFAMTEFGSGDPFSPDRSYDLTRLKADIQSALPRVVYTNFWQNWGPNVCANGKVAMSDPFWINQSQVSLPAQPPVSPVDPPPITFGTGPDSLVFKISEDAYANGDGTSDAKGDATFTVSVDGKQIGGTFTAVASHATHQEQTVTLNGYFGPGTHSVSVKFLNDASGGTAATDRNLYVDAVAYKGANIDLAGSFAVSGTKSLTVSGGTSEQPPTSSDQIVLTPTSGGSITDASGNVWTITQAKDVDKNGVPTPGGGGSAALTYVAATQTVWAQDATTLRWYSWTNGMWTGPAATSPVGNPPVVDPPVVTPPATGTPREQLLAYLQSITGNHTLIGQTTFADNNAFIADTQAFGFSPAIMFNDPWLMQWAGNAPYDPSFMPTALAHAKAGGIVGMSLLFPNPVDGGPSTDGPAVDPVQLLTPGSALNGSLNRKLDQAAGLLQQFKDAGVAVLTRFMLELDGGWFWWGDGHFSNAQQTQLYRYIVNYLRVTKGLDNLLTTFAINGGPGDYQYPGDDVVDIVGIDAYTSDLAGVYKGIYDALRAQAPTKLFALTEFGSGDPFSPDRSYDLTRLKADIQSALPRVVYTNFWQNWGPNVCANGKAAMSDPFWINQSQVILPPQQPFVDPITFGTGPDSLVFKISEDAYANGDGTSDAKGDATFTVSVDGEQIGGTFTAAASHATHQEQTVTLNGYFGPGTHSVSVRFLNDASGGTAATDRNLYVDAVAYKGANIDLAGSFAVSGIKSFTVSGGTSEPPKSITFDDEFDSFSVHRTWQQGDKWQLVAPDSPDGRGGPNWGEGGSQWWVNPNNPNTPINGIYSVSNGMLNLGLLPTPSQYQSYIDQQAGAHTPYVGALFNSSPTNDQHYGYWDIGMAVDRVPGFAFEMSLENVQLTGHWPPQINLGVSTDGSGKQTLQAHIYKNGGTSNDYSQPIDGTQQHDYGIDWEADYITFYLDDVKIFQAPNPGGYYQTDNMFAFLYTGANYSQGTGVNPPVSSLPAYAHIDYFRVYPSYVPHGIGKTITGTAGNDTQIGGVGNDTLIGLGGNDTLTGGAGADTMIGGAGNDTYYVDNVGDVVTENVGEGTDTVWASYNCALAAGSEVENMKVNSTTGLTLTGNALSHNLIGNVGNDTLIDGTGNDTLSGGAGADTMSGGTGNDTYIVDNAGDVVTEAVGGGTDTVLTSVNYTLAPGSEVEILTGAGTTGLRLTGNAFSHTINGTNSAVVGQANDTLFGGSGNDTLNGGSGADTMSGGAGNDTYIVDNAGDVVTEAVGGGADLVWASVNYALAAGTEVETLRANATTGLTLTGNAYSHNLIGNVANDRLIGGSGNDVLNGGAGADTMAGGAGNDTYIVDNAADVVNENVGEGTDTVWAGVSYTLAAGAEVEALKVNATAGLKLTGNAYSHSLVGNVGNDTLLGGAGNDTLNGGAGADTMAGGSGNDTYFVDNAGDVVNEAVGQGTDTVWASVNYSLTAGSEIEFLRANAGATGLSLTGNALANAVMGGSGNDTLDGGAGNDTLTGGAGNDVFRFLAGFGQDTITDFTAHAGVAGNKDLMDISGLGITAGTFAASVKIAAGAGSTTMVSFGGSTNSIRLLNVVPASIGITDFKLA